MVVATQGPAQAAPAEPATTAPTATVSSNEPEPRALLSKAAKVAKSAGKAVKAAGVHTGNLSKSAAEHYAILGSLSAAPQNSIPASEAVFDR